MAASNEIVCNDKLKVVNVDMARKRVIIRTTEEDPSLALDQLTSLDAKTLGLRAAAKEGVSSPTIRHCGLLYGDDKKGEVVPMINSTSDKIKPFLVIEFSGDGIDDLQFTGDSF
jgi:hypothetical protein